MATIVWETVSQHWCDLMNQPVDLLEERVYPANLLTGVGVPYHVRARKCSLGLDCNLAGYACRWSFLNPGHDPFVEKP
jgi:hypothetical protein